MPACTAGWCACSLSGCWSATSRPPRPTATGFERPSRGVRHRHGTVRKSMLDLNVKEPLHFRQNLQRGLEHNRGRVTDQVPLSAKLWT
jgi:hypothetical protein